MPKITDFHMLAEANNNVVYQDFCYKWNNKPTEWYSVPELLPNVKEPSREWVKQAIEKLREQENLRLLTEEQLCALLMEMSFNYSYWNSDYHITPPFIFVYDYVYSCDPSLESMQTVVNEECSNTSLIETRFCAENKEYLVIKKGYIDSVFLNDQGPTATKFPSQDELNTEQIEIYKHLVDYRNELNVPVTNGEIIRFLQFGWLGNENLGSICLDELSIENQIRWYIERNVYDNEWTIDVEALKIACTLASNQPAFREYFNF